MNPSETCIPFLSTLVSKQKPTSPDQEELESWAWGGPLVGGKGVGGLQPDQIASSASAFLPPCST